MNFYYGFPFITVVLWPGFAAAIDDRVRGLASPRFRPVGESLLVVAASSMAFLWGAAGNVDSAPWRSMGFAWVSAASSENQILDGIVGKDGTFVRGLTVDETVSTWEPLAATRQNSFTLQFQPPDRSTITALLFLPGTRMDGAIAPLLTEQHLTSVCRVGDSKLLLARNADQDFGLPLVGCRSGWHPGG